MKSLCSERVDDWRQKLSPLGLQCLELTGDSNLSDFSSLHHVQVICTTPVSLPASSDPFAARWESWSKWPVPIVKAVNFDKRKEIRNIEMDEGGEYNL